MKKALIICFLLILGICFTACGHILELDTPEKVAEIYYANEDYFNTAAEVILKYDGKEPRIAIYPIEEAWESDAYIGKEINGLYIEGSSLLTDLDYQILYDAFAPLMERCHFSGVAMHSSRVEFVLEGPTYGMAAELYCFLDAEFAADYTSQTDENNSIIINPYWYAEIWHD